MSLGPDSDQTSNVKLLDRFYGIFMAVGVAFLVVGVPFVFYRKTVSAIASAILIAMVAAAWAINRRGQPQRSLVLFSAGLWLILVALLFGGLPPITSATMLAVAVMLAVVVDVRAGIVYGLSYTLAWLLYIVLGEFGLAPPQYFIGKPLVAWFIGTLAIWVVLLPIPTLVRSQRRALSLQQGTLEAASDGILVVDGDRRIIASNQQFASMWRIPRELMRRGDDKALIEFVVDQLEDAQKFHETAEDLYLHPERSSDDVLVFKDGRVFERHSRPQKMDGRVRGRVWSFSDVTARAAAEKARQQSETLKTSVLDFASCAIIAAGADGVITVFNPYAEALLGYCADEVVGRHTPEIFHDPDEVRRRAEELSQELGRPVLPGFEVFIARSAETRMADEREWTYLRKDGTRVPVLLSVTAIVGPDGAVAGYMGIATDITEKRQAAERLAEIRQRMELALDGADLGLLDWDIPSGRFSQSGRVLAMLGYAPAELELNAQLFEWLTHPADRERVNAGLRAHFRGQTPRYEMEHRLRHKDDHWVWVLARGRIVERNAAGRPLRIVGTLLDISGRKRDEEALKTRETRLANLIGSLQELVFVIDTEGRITEFHRPASFEFPVGADAALGSYFPDTLPEPLSDFLAEAMVGIFADGKPREHEFATSVAGAERFFQITLSQLSNSGKYASGFLALMRDVSDMKRAAQELRIAAIAFESQEGMVITDPRGVILRVNKAFTQITGYTADEAVGQRPALLSSGRHDKAFYDEMWACIARNGSWQGEIWNKRKNGDIYPQLLTITAVRGEDGTVTNYVGTQVDITQRKEAELAIQRLAYYDPLTQLGNRRLLLDRLHHAMAVSGRSGSHAALLFLDLDRFKELNDSRGHDMGDLLLQEVARRLGACVREGDTVARLGGDEFVVLLEGLSEDGGEAATQAEQAGRKILAELNRPYLLGGSEHASTPSIGGTLFVGQRQGADELLKQADDAMYQAKAAGRNALRFFVPPP